MTIRAATANSSNVPACRSPSACAPRADRATGSRPAVTEVVLVGQPLTRLRQHLVQPHPPLVDADHIFLESRWHDVLVGLRVVHVVAAGQPVQEVVLPPHHHLGDVVDPVRREVAGDVEPPATPVARPR